MLNGGAGTDTLNVDIGAANTYAMSNVSSIETVNANFTAAGTLSLLGSSGVTSAVSNGSVVAAIFSNIGSTSVGLGVTNNAVDATFNFTASAVAGTADSATLTLSGQTAGTDTVAGVETLNIVSTGSANALTALTAAAATTINISGAQTLNLGTANTVATTITSTNTAGVTLVSNNTAAVTITGGSGNDAITMTGGAAVSDNVNAGAGNDTVTITANLATTDTLNGGDGTDTLVSTSALLAAYALPTPVTITNFETLKLSDALGASLTAANVQAGIATVDLAFGTGANAVTMEAGNKTVKVGAANTGTLTVNDTGTATTDTLAVTSSAAAASIFGAAAGGLVVNGFETVTLTGSGTGAATTQAATVITLTPDTGGTSTLNLAGSNTFSTTGAITANVINASGLTGSAKLTMGAAAATGLTSITGSANADTLIGDASSSIDGGAGNDTITGGSGADTLVGNAGNDQITSGGGNDVITGGDGNDAISVATAAGAVNVDGGAGNDTITMGGTLTSTDTLVGGDGTDTLVLTNADVTAANALTISAVTTLNTNTTGIEQITFDTLTQDIDLGRLDGISTLSLNALGGAATVSGLAATNSVTLTVAPGFALGLTLGDATGSADVISLAMNASGSIDASATAINLTSVETVNFAANDSDTTSTGATADAAHQALLTDITTTDVLSRVVVTGNAASLSLVLTGSTAVNTLDASAFAGNLTAALASTVAATVTGGAGADVLTGGTKADSINGGAGSDTIGGGLGSDVLDGGAGTNTLDLGAGSVVSATDSDGNVAITGVVVNLTSAALSGATVNTGAAQYISGALSSVAAGTSAYLFNSSSNLASVAVDTVSNFTKVTGTSGIDYIAGGASAESLSGGNGADYISGGNGADTINGGAGADTIVLTETAANSAADVVQLTDHAASDTITGFATGVDKVSLNGGAVAVVSTTLAAIAGTTTLVFDTIAHLGALGVTIGDQSGASVVHYAVASDTGAIFYDANGDWTAGSVQIGTVGVIAGLVATDFVI